MEQVSARASLVTAPDVGDGLSMTIPRSEIQAVLAAEEEPIELVLDVTRFSDGEAAGTQNVSVKWERSDLEQLLKDAQGDHIQLTFDAETLRQATDEAEVDAHGLREATLILAVAATTAMGGAQAASAIPDYGAGEAPIAQSSAVDDRAFARAEAPPLAPDDRSVARSEVASPTPEIPYLSHGEGVSPADLGIATGTGPDDRTVARVDAPPVGPDDRAFERTDGGASPTAEIPYLSHGEGVSPADLGIASGTGPDDRTVARVDAPPLGPDDRAVARTEASSPAGPEIPYLSQGQGVTPAELGIGTGTSPDDRALPRTDPVAATGGGTASDSSTFSAPSPETVAVFGAILLAITGAFFLVGKDRRRVRPI